MVADAVNDLETIAASLSQKIWQKINIVQAMVAAMPTTSVPVTRRDEPESPRLDANNLDDEVRVATPASR